MKTIPRQYVKLVDHLRKVCKQLHWKFSLKTDLVKRWDIENGIAFTIDGIEYLVSKVSTEDALATPTYYASVVMTNPGHREEPPSEDERVLSGDDTRYAEKLVMRLIDVHWSERRNWVAESLIEFEQSEAEGLYDSLRSDDFNSNG